MVDIKFFFSRCNIEKGWFSLFLYINFFKVSIKKKSMLLFKKNFVNSYKIKFGF